MESYLIVGLGNPGAEYAYTRHNLGIRALRHWVKEQIKGGHQAKNMNEADSAAVAEVVIGEKRVYCLFPLTFMNTSGRAVSAFMKNHPIEKDRLLIVHDELEVPFGEIRSKESGSAHGHNGVRSIHEFLGTQEIERLRLGVGRPPEGMPADRYVLAKFSAEEEAVIESGVLPRASEEITKWIERSLQPSLSEDT